MTDIWLEQLLDGGRIEGTAEAIRGGPVVEVVLAGAKVPESAEADQFQGVEGGAHLVGLKSVVLERNENGGIIK